MVINIFEKFEHTFAIKSVDKEKRLIRGTASLEEEDRDNEIIALSAIDHSLTTFLSNPVIRYGHKEPIGRAIKEGTSVNWTEKTFVVTAYISDKTQASKEAWGLIEDGVIKSFSIGGKVLERETIKEKDTGREITKITKMELYEVSVVDIPSNRKSFFEVIAKSIIKADFTCPYCGKDFEDEKTLNAHKAHCSEKESIENLKKEITELKAELKLCSNKEKEEQKCLKTKNPTNQSNLKSQTNLNKLRKSLLKKLRNP